MRPLQIYFKSSGEEITLQSAEWKDDEIVCRSEMTPQFNLGEMDSFMFTHKTGTDMFDGYVTEYGTVLGEPEMYCEFIIKIHGLITQNATATQQLKYRPDVSPIEFTGGTFGGAELKIEYSSPEDDYKNLWSNMESKPGLILDEVGTFTKENSMFKIGDKVIIVKMEDHFAQSNSIDRRWFLDKEILTITGVRGPGEYFDYTCVDKDDYKSHVVGSWLKHAGKQPKKLKYPVNAITRAQALKLAKQLHPKVTHIVMKGIHPREQWKAFEGVSGFGDNCYKTDNNAHEITIPIRYDGNWKDSIYPKMYFSSAVFFEGFDQHVTVLEDGSLKVGCNTVRSKVVDMIIRHRIAELKKFPGAKKKPVKKKAGKK